MNVPKLAAKVACVYCFLRMWWGVFLAIGGHSLEWVAEAYKAKHADAMKLPSVSKRIYASLARIIQKRRKHKLWKEDKDDVDFTKSDDWTVPSHKLGSQLDEMLSTDKFSVEDDEQQWSSSEEEASSGYSTESTNFEED